MQLVTQPRRSSGVLWLKIGKIPKWQLSHLWLHCGKHCRCHQCHRRRHQCRQQHFLSFSIIFSFYNTKLSSFFLRVFPCNWDEELLMHSNQLCTTAFRVWGTCHAITSSSHSFQPPHFHWWAHVPMATEDELPVVLPLLRDVASCVFPTRRFLDVRRNY